MSRLRILYTGTQLPYLELRHAEVRHIPMLEVECLDYELDEDLDPTVFVFYSRNGVDCFKNRIDYDVFELEVWCVGDRTAAAVAAQLDVEANRPRIQNYEGLVEALSENLADDDVVVSFEIKDTERKLADEDLPGEIVSVEVYDTKMREIEAFKETVEEFDPDWAVFTSPKGYRAFVNNWFTPRKRKVRRLPFRVAALGTTTEAAMEKTELDADFVPHAPDSAALLLRLAEGEAV